MKKLFLTTVLFVLIGLFINTNNLFSCQCPTDIPPTNVSWTSQVPVTIRIYDAENDWCDYEVYYCWRQYDIYGTEPYDPVVEVWIYDYEQTENCEEDFCGYDVWELIKALAERIIVLNPNQLNWYYPPCNDPNWPNYSVLLFTCWDQGNPCGSVYCRYSYWVRTCSGQIIMTELGHEELGNGCTNPCTSHCD